MTDILLKQILDKLNSAKRVLFCTLHTTIFFTYNDISQHLSSSAFLLTVYGVYRDTDRYFNTDCAPAQYDTNAYHYSRP